MLSVERVQRHSDCSQAAPAQAHSESRRAIAPLPHRFDQQRQRLYKSLSPRAAPFVMP